MLSHDHVETSCPEAASRTELERLGRRRPDVFSSAVSEVLFVAAVLLSMFMAEFFISGFNTLLPAVVVELQIPIGAQVWPSSVFSLITGSFLLPLGRLADMFGGFVVFASGLVWYLIWTIAAGFSTDYHMLIATRALQGLGPAAFLPAGVMLLGKLYWPGPRKNLVFGLYGAFAPLGFFAGIIVGGGTGQLLSWRWYFWIGAATIFLVCISAAFGVPRDFSRVPTGRMDYWGVLFIVPALALLVFAVTDGPHAPSKWNTPYVIATLVLAVVLLAMSVFVEGRLSPNPLLPGSLFKPKYMKTLVVSLAFSYGNFGIFLYYASFYLTNVMEYNTLQTAVAFTPMAVGGIIISAVGGFTLHLLPGRVLLVLAGAGGLLSVLLFALVPEGGSYWAYILPAMLGATLGIDITYTVTNVFITNNIPQKYQGAAGALINSLLFLPISLFVGVADAVAAQYEEAGERASYKAAFWFGTACAAVSLLLFCFIDPGKADSQLRVEDKNGS